VDEEDAPRQLIVEGQDDRQAVVELMRHHIDAWPKIGKEGAPVIIKLGGGANGILSNKYLQVTLKTACLQILGVILDADGGIKAEDRYASFRDQCKGMFPDLPKSLPKDGLIANNGEKALGLWVMPDNLSDGCLETFLRTFVPEPAKPLWTYAESYCAESKKFGAPYRDHHVDKANVYSFLALQDPPGQSPGNAISRKVLDPGSPSAEPFLKWFRKLYGI
jgi:hypothetical protein